MTVKKKAKISRVFPDAREWAGHDIWFISGLFDDGSEWSFGCKKQPQDRIKEMELLVGQELEYEVEPKPDRSDRAQWKLCSWPGKPQQQPFGGGGGGKGGGGYTPRFRDTEQGAREERMSISRSVALQQAVIHGNSSSNGSGNIDLVLNAADQFYQWLVANQPAPPTPQQEERSESSAAAPQQSSPPVQREFKRLAKPACPKCGAIESVRPDQEGGYYCWKKIESGLFDQEGAPLKGCGHKWKDVQELAASLGVHTGLDVKNAFDIAKEEIVKARQGKDLERLTMIRKRMAERAVEGRLTSDQVDDLDRDIQAAKKVLEAGEDQARWQAEQVRKAQEREDRAAGLPEPGSIPF